MSESKPAFRFFPAAYDVEGVFEASEDKCDICQRPAGWMYGGAVYAEGTAPETCARCIHDGKLAAALNDGFMQLVDASLDDADPDLAKEVLQRTPGFPTLNPIDWPVIDGTPLAFLGFGDSETVTADPAASKAVEAAWTEEFEEPMEGPSPYALVFRSLDGGQHRVVFDFS